MSGKLFIRREKEIVARLTPARTAKVAAKVLGRSAREVEKVWREMGKPIRPFTPEEKLYVRNRWCCDSVTKIAAVLGRSPEEVVAEAERMDLAVFETDVCSYDRWSEAEKDTVRRMIVAGTGYQRIAKVLGRSVEAVKTLARCENMAGPRNGGWTEEEDAILRKWYGLEPSKKTAERIGRTPDAARARAKALGLKGRPIGKR